MALISGVSSSVFLAMSPSRMFIVFVFTMSIMASYILPVVSFKDHKPCDYVTKLYAPDLNLKSYTERSKHPIYFRYFKIDVQSNFLFVGAMNRLFGFYLNNIENKSQRLIQDFKPEYDKRTQCHYSGKDQDSECQNHIRLLIRNTTLPGDTFYMCSTGAYSPVAYQLRLANNRFQIMKNDLIGVGICPYDPFDNTTVIIADTPGNIPTLFAASVTDSIRADALIARPAVYNRRGELIASYVRTYKAKSEWLNEPQFVASFDVGDHVYFFFREVALEYTNCGKKIYSRLARVCKNDYGGSQNYQLQNVWMSFVKARLNCSIPGEFPYYFDEIQDVFKVGDIFYGLFTTNINGIKASAICGFTIHDIDSTFYNSSFKEQESHHSNWLPVDDWEIPNPRPGDCRASRRPNDNNLNSFVSRSRILMDKAVPHKYKKPIFVQSNILMTKLVVVENVAGDGDHVFVTASNEGVIYKIAAWKGLTDLDAPTTFMVTNYIPFDDELAIWSLSLYKNWIYFGTDWKVGQLNLETCNKYKKIDLCIYDPYCGWDNVLNECRSNARRNLIGYRNTDLLYYPLVEAIRKQVGDLYYFEKVSKISGSTVTLKVDYLLHISGTVRWTRNNTDIKSDRHILAQDNSLIITDIRKADEGFYKAIDQLKRTVAEYSLVVETSKEQIEQKWMRKFDQWCDEFERYQEDIRQWERKCESCCQEAALTNIVPALGGK